MFFFKWSDGIKSLGPLFLPSRPSWRGAHNWLRGHIWLVVIRAFVASQVGGVKTQPPAGNKHGRLVYVRYYSSLFTFTESLLHLRNFVANLALSRLRTFGAAPLAEIWWQGGRGHKNILTDRVKSTRKMITIKFRDKGQTWRTIWSWSFFCACAESFSRVEEKVAKIECEIKYQRAVKIQMLRKNKNVRRARKGGKSLNFKR